MSKPDWNQLPGCRLFTQSVANFRSGDSYTFPIEGQEQYLDVEPYSEYPDAPTVPRAITHTVAGVLHGMARVSYPSFEPYDYAADRGMGWNRYSRVLMGGPREPCTLSAPAPRWFVWWCLVPRVPEWRLGFEVVTPGIKILSPATDEAYYIIPLDQPVKVGDFELDVYEIGKRVALNGPSLVIDGQPDARVALVWHNRA